MMSDMVDRKHQKELVNHIIRQDSMQQINFNKSFITKQKQALPSAVASLKVIMLYHPETL